MKAVSRATKPTEPGIWARAIAPGNRFPVPARKLVAPTSTANLLATMANRRLLIAVGQAAPSADSLPFGVRLLIDAAEEILVISPTLPKRLDWLASATDKAKKHADERLRVVLDHLETIGADPQGAIGADDPLLAFDDAIAQFSPTHLLVALRDEDRAGWQERLLEALHERARVPITVFDTPSS